MGSFFTNVQVRVRGGDVVAARDRILEALRAMAAEGGLVEARDGEPVDRTILVDHEEGWVGVYDEATEDQDSRKLDALAGRLSAALSTEAVTTLVHDSDVLVLHLFRDGARVDRFDSHPAYFGKVSAEDRAKVAGHPDAWRSLLVHGDVAALAKVWGKEKLFAEETLAATAALVGVSMARIGVGYRYAPEGDARFTSLRFRLADRPAYERDAQGPPSFEMGGHMRAMELSAGHPFDLVCAVRNGGGAATGLSLTLFGDAIAEGLVAVDTVDLLVGHHKDGPRVSIPFVDARDADGARFRLAELLALEIPAGTEGGLYALAAARLPPDRHFALAARSQLHAHVHGRALKTGRAILDFAFTAHAARENPYVYEIALDVKGTPRRPLRAPDAVAHALRPMQDRTTQIVLVSFDLDREAAVDVAAHAITRWGELFAPKKKLSLTTFVRDGGRPKSGSAKRDGFFSSARWEKFRQEMRTECVVTAVQGERAPRRGDGFSFGGSLHAGEIAEDPQLPTLGLWLDVGDASRTRLEEVEGRAAEIVDVIMRAHAGVQAIATRWGWTPAWSLDRTPYESACGVGGDEALRRSWLTRYLRGVDVGTVWLGGALWKRIEGREALAAIGKVEACGEGAKVTLGDEEAVTRAEGVLANVLAGR